jgi:thiol peroxidase
MNMSGEHPSQGFLINDPVKLKGRELQEEEEAPDFVVLDNNFGNVGLTDASGKTLIIASVMSVDTPVCDTLIRRLDSMSSELGGEIWIVSMDLPFVQKRWCESLDVHHVKTLSDFRDRSFAHAYGVLIADGPFAGITARAVFVVTKQGKLNFVQYLRNLSDEPDYPRLKVRSFYVPSK